MENYFDKFLDTIAAPNTRKAFKRYRVFGEVDFTDCTYDYLEQVIVQTKPNSYRSVINACHALKAYAEYLGNEQLHKLAQDLDRKAIWKKAKPDACKRFISHPSFECVCQDLNGYNELNPLYFRTLFRCVFEGIYNDDLSVIKNLRASDIHENIVTLHEDNGHTYDLQISTKLADDLRKLGGVHVWIRRNRYGEFPMQISGLYDDSCFKVEKRKDFSEYSYRYSYYRVLRTIAKEYLEYNLLPLQLYVSGIMYRIGLKFAENGIRLRYAFSEQNRDRLVGKIISDELNRCNYNIEVKAFRQLVMGHLDVFFINEWEY